MKTLIYILSIFILVSCDFEKDVKIKLPPYKKELVAESYLERGQPFKLLLLESEGYFDLVKLDSLQIPIVRKAKVLLSANGKTDSIQPFPFIDFAGFKLYNFSTLSPLEYDTVTEYTLSITDSIGRKLEGKTRFLPIPSFDSIVVKYRDTDSLARFLMWVRDFPNQTNCYRLIFNEDSLTGAPVLEFTFSDQSSDNGRLPIGTSNRFTPGKTMFIRLFHIEQQYYNYLESISDANRANGNPFAQPATILSPMKGDGYGIFTTLNYKLYKVKY